MIQPALLEKLEQLPEPLQIEILHYVEFLLKRNTNIPNHNYLFNFINFLRLQWYKYRINQRIHTLTKETEGSNLVLELAGNLVGSVDHTQSNQITDYLGVLKESPNFNGDPVEIQEEMRNEWS